MEEATKVETKNAEAKKSLEKESNRKVERSTKNNDVDIKALEPKINVLLKILQEKRIENNEFRLTSEEVEQSIERYLLFVSRIIL